jgi:hypothetical protein
MSITCLKLILLKLKRTHLRYKESVTAIYIKRGSLTQECHQETVDSKEIALYLIHYYKRITKQEIQI